MPEGVAPTWQNVGDNESGPRAALTAGDLATTYWRGCDMRTLRTLATPVQSRAPR